MYGWENTILTGATHILAFALLMTPIYGVVAAPVGILFFQSTKDPLGRRKPDSLDLLAYRNKLTKTYLFLVVGLLLSLMATAVGLQESIVYSHGVVSLVCTAVFANLAGRRLVSIGWSRALAMLLVVPVLGHIFLIWLAYKPLEARR